MNFIDLFAGAGGLSEGFIRAGFEPVAHVEMDKAACFSLRTRSAYHYLKASNKYTEYIKYLKGEIKRDELYALMPPSLLDSIINLSISKENNNSIFEIIDKQLRGRHVDLILGGPPCQAYSLVGRARSENSMKSDSRNYLYVQYGEFLSKYEPTMFVFENVLGLRSAGNGIYLNNMEKLFEKRGYKIEVNTLSANNFGVAQKRKRLIIIGWKKDLQITPPNIEGYRSTTVTKVFNVLNDLPHLHAGEGKDKNGSYSAPTNSYLTQSYIRNGIDVLTQHIARPHTEQDKEIYRIAVDKWENKQDRLNYNDLPERLRTHKNTSSFTDRFKVVGKDLGASHTVVAHISKDGHYYIHPDINQNRSLSIREAARLQSFPDDFYFEGIKEGQNRGAAFKQIGNAVPPLMAQKIATIIKEILSR